MTDIVDRLRLTNADFLHEEAADEIERLREANAKAAKVITQCHSALSVLALATVGSHIAQRALRNIEETLQ